MKITEPKEAKMKNRLLSFTALGFLLAALFVTALPARGACHAPAAMRSMAHC